MQDLYYSQWYRQRQFKLEMARDSIHSSINMNRLCFFQQLHFSSGDVRWILGAAGLRNEFE